MVDSKVDLIVSCVLSVLFFIAVTYFMLKRPPVATKPPDTSKSAVQGSTVNYVPVQTGTSTETRRVFNTSKGLRVYNVNTDDMPLPHS